jgi:hypothetical protein
MQFKTYEPDIEVLGASLNAVLEAFSVFPALAQKFLKRYEMVDRRNGRARANPDKWYPLDEFLAAYEAIYTSVGPRTLFTIGQRIPDAAVFPPTVKDIYTAVKSVNVAYHMNHRKHGQVMFDPSTGEMLEGIGHYGYYAVPGEKRIVSKCQNPYPCEFDMGIMSSMANRFQPQSFVEHDIGPCRAQGGASCTYVISWHPRG